ncbi:hypothetical protein GS532_17645 [Rhodococcus hoagii]|nr:hypothetical protein [Prescottella equi]MBM4685646.1 hypothetical protein [Prescottella equi]NKV67892.1 hypothetical protein [Prescottella equi]NKV68484.1 hypothetical protein [Prescottella equi]
MDDNVDVGHDWREAHLSKLSALAALAAGWDGPDSQPLSDASASHFEEFLTRVAGGRSSDAEPMLTDEGFIRLEWRSAGYSYAAELGADSLYMCALAPSSADDADVELDTFDLERLVHFFESGDLR